MLRIINNNIETHYKYSRMGKQEPASELHGGLFKRFSLLFSIQSNWFWLPLHCCISFNSLRSLWMLLRFLFMLFFFLCRDIDGLIESNQILVRALAHSGSRSIWLTCKPISIEYRPKWDRLNRRNIPFSILFIRIWIQIETRNRFELCAHIRIMENALITHSSQPILCNGSSFETCAPLSIWEWNVHF